MRIKWLLVCALVTVLPVSSFAATSWVPAQDADCTPDAPFATSTDIIDAQYGEQYCQHVTATGLQTKIDVGRIGGCKDGLSIGTEDAVTLTVETCRTKAGLDCSNYISATLSVVADAGDYVALRPIDIIGRILHLNVSAVTSTADVILNCYGERQK